MKLFAILPLIALISNVVLCEYILYLNPKDLLNRLYALVEVSLIVWSLGDMTFLLANTPYLARLGDKLSTDGACLTVFFLLYFFIIFTKHKVSPKKLVPLLAIPMLTIIYLETFTSILVTGVKHISIGYSDIAGKLYGIDVIIIALYAIAGLVFSFAYYRNSKKANQIKESHQASLLIIGVSVPLVFSVAMTLLPIIIHKPIISISSTATTVTAFFVAYAIIKHDLMTITPAKAVDNIIRTMADYLLVFDEDKKLVIVGKSFLEIIGKNESDLIGVKPEDIGLHFPDIFKWLAESGYVSNFETHMTTKDNKTIDLSINASTMKQKNEIIGFVLLMRDITTTNELVSNLEATKKMIEQYAFKLQSANEQLDIEKRDVERKVEERTKELSTARANLLASIYNMPLGFLLIDNNSQVLLTNSNAKQYLQCDKLEVHLDLLKKCLSSSEFNYDDYFKQAAVDYRRINVNDVNIGGRFYKFMLSPIITRESDKNIFDGLVVLIQDITEEKILNRSRDEFFSIASHELRTPLTAIRGNSSMILEYYKDVIQDPTLHELVTDIHDSSIRLVGIVNDFLDVSRVEQGKFVYHIKPDDLSQIVEKVIYEMSSNAKEAGISLLVGDKLKTIGNLPQIMVDGDRVKQILFNLIGNALRFTKPGQSIAVDATQIANVLKVTVTDNGQGIAKEMQSLLFHKFQQAGESLLTRQTSKGTGLGLYISRLIAQGMGGKLYLEFSEPGKGSIFTLELPVARTEVPQQPVVRSSV